MNLSKILGVIWLYAQRPLLIALIVILAAFGIKYNVRAADLDVEGRALFSVLHEQMNYPMPVSYPEYHLGSEGAPEACAKYVARGRACYWHGGIWVSPALLLEDQDKFLSILLHENVHHLQWEKSGDAFNCQQNWEREREAYKAQSFYMSRVWHKRVEFGLPQCPPEQGGPQ